MILVSFIKRLEISLCSIVLVILRIDKGCVCWSMRILV